MNKDRIVLSGRSTSNATRMQGAGWRKLLLAGVASMALFGHVGASMADEDTRVLVELPEMMQQHMLSNMRGHLAVIDELLVRMSEGKFDAAAELAEARLGMSSLGLHGASHLAKFMPAGMQAAGTRMHRAASRFALRAQEEDLKAAMAALSEVTSACVACHAGYRIR